MLSTFRLYCSFAELLGVSIALETVILLTIWFELCAGSY